MPVYDQFYTTTVLATAGVLGSAYIGYKLYQTWQSRLPTEWKRVGTLKELYVYPIKSCGSVMLQTAECSALGLKQGWLRDRILMVIDDKNNFITARGYGELVTVHPSVKGPIITIKHPKMETLCVNLAEIIESGIQPEIATVWGVPVPVYDCGREASEWFTRFLNRPAITFRLVYYASYKCRDLLEYNKFYKFTKYDTVNMLAKKVSTLVKSFIVGRPQKRGKGESALSDEVSYNIINEASLEDLNTRLPQDCQVTLKNFRPNFVLKGAKPYVEDEWKFVKVGDNIFEIIKTCNRCVLTTVDPETGVRNSKNEPIQTLREYRSIEDPEERRASGDCPRMGMQMALRSKPGVPVSLNDPIYVA